MNRTTLGVLIMLCSTTLMNVGMVLQKKAVDAMPPLHARGVVGALRLVFRSPLWILGWLMTTVAIVSNMVALGLADITIIQPLNGFGMVVLAVFSRLYLGERLTGRTLWGIALAMAGVVVIGVAAIPGRAFASVAEIMACYRQPAAMAVLGLFVLTVVTGWAVGVRSARIQTGILFAFVAACSSVVGLTFSKGLFAMFTLAGVPSSLSTWHAYILLVPGFSFAILALFLQQLSFQKGQAVVVTPVFSAFSVVLPLAMGLWVFGEAIQWATLLAMALVAMGVILLGSREGATTTGRPASLTS